MWSSTGTGFRRCLTRLQWLEEMLAEQGDPKTQAVRKLLEGLPKEDDQGQPTKVALFTTYKDTAQHLFKQFGGDVDSLKSDVRVQSNLVDARWMSLLTGGDDQNRRRSVLERFAPLATHRETEPLDDPSLLRKIEPLRAQGIELLIATDVLSEGQNLQDAQFLVNYDLPWNPVRMISAGWPHRPPVSLPTTRCTSTTSCPRMAWRTC